ncbi:MAG TPA: AlkA N-terminal domain-containing protein [Bdellovibrionota bacterium]|nr:AlkA N-terminal domain-containing protein [Bdellovibrionota bacterium]
MSRDNAFYEAMLARDYRFDGKFFVGVKTTGIYCRPICPARPKRENVEFFVDALGAERAGYRPCLRCRPESAPLSPAWHGKSAVVQRALRSIADEGFFDSGEERFAERFGVSARHLRRLFVDEVGQTPKQIAFNNRLNFARKLITESRLPMTKVAFTAGFTSLRRFNDAFKKRFERSPTQIRREQKTTRPSGGIELSLSYRPPLDWEHLLEFFRSHRIPGIENVDGNTYERVFRAGDGVGALRVRPDTERPQLLLEVFVEDPRHLFAVVQRVRRSFDLNSDPLLVANEFRTNKFLDSLAHKYPGLRVAQRWDPFETAVCTILGQLVSVEQASRLVGQLVAHYGERVVHPISGSKAFLFPTPERLVGASLDEVKTTATRKRSILEIAELVHRGSLDFTFPQSPGASREKLLRVAGVGAWSSEYVHLRGLGDTDAFPATDLILRRALEMHPGFDVRDVSPWRAYAAIYLWRHYAAELSRKKRKTT